MTIYRTHTGFTLIEMIATVAVLAILVTVGIPSFQETMGKHRMELSPPARIPGVFDQLHLGNGSGTALIYSAVYP